MIAVIFQSFDPEFWCKLRPRMLLRWYLLLHKVVKAEESWSREKLKEMQLQLHRSKIGIPRSPPNGVKKSAFELNNKISD